MGVYRQIETGLGQNPCLSTTKNSIEQTFLQFLFGHFNIGKVTMTSALVDVKRLAISVNAPRFTANRLANFVWANFSAHLFGQLFRQILFRQHFWHFHFDNFSEFVWATLSANSVWATLLAFSF